MKQPSNRNNKTTFTFSLKQTLEWHDNESESGSETDEDFWRNWQPEIDKQIIRNHNRYFGGLLAEIAENENEAYAIFDRPEKSKNKERPRKPHPKKKLIVQ